MPNLLESLAGGLRSAAGVLNPDVQKETFAEDEKLNLLKQVQQKQQQQFLIENVVKGIQSGSIDPQMGQAALTKLGVDIPTGQTPQTQALVLAQKKEQLKQQYLQSPEAQQFISKNDDIGLIRDMARRGLVPVDEALKALKESRDALKPTSFGGGVGYLPDAQGGGQLIGKTDTTTTPKTAYGANNQLLEFDPATRMWKPAQMQPVATEQPNAPTANMQGDPRQVMAEIARITDPAEREAATQAYRVQLAQGGQPIYKPTPTEKPLTAAGKLNADLAAKRITPEQFNAAIQTTMPPTESTDAIAQAIAEGRMQVPSGFAMRSPYWQGIIAKVVQIDPKFDAAKYGARAAAERAFASGPEARNVTALNTVIGHLGTLDEAATALQNNDLRLFNTVANRLALETGKPEIINFGTAKEAVAEETVRVFRQVGASDAEAKRWGELINASNSPAQLKGNISTLGKLLDSRVSAISRQYERTVNQQGNPAKVDPENRVRLDQLIGGGMPKVTNDADYAKLPSGTSFIDPEGKTRRKP